MSYVSDRDYQDLNDFFSLVFSKLDIISHDLSDNDYNVLHKFLSRMTDLFVDGLLDEVAMSVCQINSIEFLEYMRHVID
jgi:hypothetical protein